jgi:rhodanese-related sulfurtransferase
VLDGDEQICHVDEVASPSAEQVVLDVRNPPELTNVGAFPQALNIPVDQLRQRLGELPKDKEILVACQVGLRGHVAYRLLRQHGFKVRNLTGGFKTFQMTMAKF